ncbi:MAG: cytochrome c [bacterium]|nr:cytochrome c [bacterium]
MKPFLKWLGIALGILVLVLVVFAGYIFWQASSIMSQTYPDIKGKNIYVPSDSATVARGRQLMRGVGTCGACHGLDLSGQEQDMGPFAYYVAPNITFGKGGLPANYSIQDLDLIVRHGIKRDKTGALIMPSFHLNRISDEDLAAIYAYLKTAPKVDKERPNFSLGPIGKMVLVQGGLLTEAAITDHNFKSPKRPEIAPTAEYGKYLAEIACMGCHAQNYSGGKVFEGDPKWPSAANLTKHMKHYTNESFAHFLKTGVRADGTVVDTLAMPIYATKFADSLEMAALFSYLSALPEQPDSSFSWHEYFSKH